MLYFLLLNVHTFLYLQCREIGCDIHDEIFRVLHELHTALKTYQTYQANCKQAETKLRLAEGQRQKVELSIPKEKLDRSKKYRMIEKDVQKVNSNLKFISIELSWYLFLIIEIC